MEHICVHEQEIGKLKADVENLVGWQKEQNGSIYRVEDKLDKLQYWIMGIVAGMAVQFLLLLLRK